VRTKEERVYSPRNHYKPKEDTPMHELNFVRNPKLNEAWREVQWNFMEDMEKAVEGQISQ
jgi:hypothetical protein